MKYRKLPVEVDAWRVTDLVSQKYKNEKQLPIEVNQALKDKVLIFGTASIHVTTLEGKHIAKIGDVLIRGVRGEFYGIDPDIFRDTYERA